MIRLPRLLVLGALACALLVPAIAHAVPRSMLLETFTNYSCPPCASNNPIVHQFTNDYGTALVIGIQDHVNWPGPSDPFYLLTSTEVGGRRTYYNVNGVPSNFSDGASTGTASLGALQAAANERLLADSPFALTVTHVVNGANIDVTVTIDAVGVVPSGNLKVQVALSETAIHYATAPGTNGETDFYNTMRRMMPDQNGTTLTITQGQQQVLHLSTPVVAAWTLANIRSIAWIQNDDTHEVLQAATSEVRPAYAFYFGSLAAADVVPQGTMRDFEAKLVNLGADADIYDIHITKDLPGDWSGSVCVGTTCYPPFVTDISVPVNSGTTGAVQVDITPLATSGSGTMTLTATSRGNPAKSWTRTFKVISGVPILCVDGDYGSNFDTWYTAALDSTHKKYATWDRSAHGKLTADQLQKFFIVVWDADLAYPALSTDDMAALGTFLDKGGRLFISGQDIGWSLCDVSSADRTAASVAWYQNYLGATYVMDDTNILTLTGVAGDPISNGMSFSISGGTGSGQQDYPDEINPRTGASALFTYAAGREAGVRYQLGAAKVVYLAYGFQAQNTLASRTTLMNRVLSWFDVDLLDVPNATNGSAVTFHEPRAMPNPFGPSTKVSFVVGGRVPVTTTVTVYDVAGRKVRTLWNGPAAPGERAVTWDGRESSGALARSGVYLANVRVGATTHTVKLLLTR